jgi:hypothetical protein
MKKSLTELYALAVCFVTLVCFAVALGIGLYDIIQIGNPDFTVSSYEYERHQSDESFRQSCGDEYSSHSDAEISALRKESWERVLEMEQRSAYQSLVQIFIILIIDTIVFVIHWQIAKRVRLTEQTGS